MPRPGFSLSRLRPTRRVAVAAGLVAGIGVLYALGAADWLDLSFLQAQMAALSESRAGHPWAFACAYVALFVAVTGLSLPGAGVLSLAGGALFGFWTGLLLVSVAATAGATLAMLAARYLLREAVRQRFEAVFKRIDRGLARDGVWYLLVLRLTPLVPYFAINLAMGLTRMPARTFWWVTQLGMLPVMAVFLYLGTELASIASLREVLSLRLLVGLSLLALIPPVARLALRGWQLRRLYARWTRPTHFDYDLAVIGAGSAGLVGARVAAAMQARVVLIEHDAMGGECLNRGCVPSKALLRAARAAHDANGPARFGVLAEAASVDFEKVMRRVHETIESIAPHDSVARYAALGVECLPGPARFASPWEIDIVGPEGVRRISAARTLVATGSRPQVPDLPGLDTVPHATTDTVWQLTTLPARLVVLGAGPAGCELAQAFARLGSQVVMVQRATRLLPREDEAAAKMLARCFRDEGIAVLVEAEALGCEISEQGPALRVRVAGEEGLVPFDLLLLTTGRVPAAHELGLAALGVALRPDGSPEIDGHGAMSLPNLFAAGDVTGIAGSTPSAAAQATRAAVTALFGRLAGARVARGANAVPRLVFTSPQVGQVGLTATEAAARGIRVDITTLTFDDQDRALIDGTRGGFISVLTRAGGARIVGATVVAEEAEGLIALFALALRQDLGLDDLLQTSLPYPTQVEAVTALAARWREGRVLPWQRRALQTFLGWRFGRANRQPDLTTGHSGAAPRSEDQR